MASEATSTTTSHPLAFSNLGSTVDIAMYVSRATAPAAQNSLRGNAGGHSALAHHPAHTHAYATSHMWLAPVIASMPSI